MARRKNDGSGVLVVAALLVAAIALLGPFAIALRAIYCEVAARRFRGASRASQTVSTAEKAAISRAEKQINGLDARIAGLWSRGEALGMAQRADGLFDARNTGAREINRRIERLYAEKASLQMSLEDLKDSVADRLEAWVRARSSLIGARAGLVTFVGVFLAVTANEAAAKSTGLDPSAILFGTGTDGADRLAASLAATFAGALAMWIFGAIGRALLAS